MTRSELKAEIKQTFGTVTRFGRITGITSPKLWAVLSGRNETKEDLHSVIVVFRSFKNAEHPEKIYQKDRNRIALQVFTHFRTRSSLVRRFPDDFTDKFLSDVVRGRIEYRSKRVDKLVNILNELDVKQINS